MNKLQRSVLKGLVEHFQSDTDIFLLGVAGLIRRTLLGGLSGPLMLYVTFRRIDQVFGRIDTYLYHWAQRNT